MAKADEEQLRLECLKLAAQVGGSSEGVLKIARRYYDFVMGPQEPDLSGEPETISALVS